MNVCFQYDFHAVGQGLFASGCLYQANTRQPRFIWVYDCGCMPTVPPMDWTAKMNQLALFTRGKERIDLLTLSHFDNDHITGVTALLARFQVNTLMLPYVPLWERLLIAFASNIGPGDERMGYFVDPVAYLQNIAGGGIGQVIVVRPSEGEEPTESAGAPVTDPSGDRLWKLLARSEHPSAGDPLAQEFGKVAPQTEFLSSGQPLTVEGLWEFVPYNAKRSEEIAPRFTADVEKLRDRLLSPQKASDIEAALAALKAAYDDEFGSNARQRNILSLFLYAGPVYPTWQENKLMSPFSTSFPFYPSRHPCYYRVHHHAPGHTRKCSLLYAGDGYLNTANTFDSLNFCLGAPRMTELGVVQVAHHGARGNWHAGLAAKLDPAFNVFSSRCWKAISCRWSCNLRSLPGCRCRWRR